MSNPLHKNQAGQPSTNGGHFAAAPARPEATLILERDKRPSAQFACAAGFTYQAENYTADALLARLNQLAARRGEAPATDLNELLDGWAARDGINADDIRSYDSDVFPKPVYDDQITIEDHPWLGREYWDFPGYDADPRTAEDALNVWAETLELPESTTEALWQGTDYAKDTAWNLNVIAENAKRDGINLDKLGYPMPVRHN